MDKPTPEYLFVYGTLRRDSKNDMYKLLARHAKFKSEAWFNGNLYQISYYPGAVSSDIQTDKVWGEVYELLNPELILPRLDDYEECGENHIQPTEYIREKHWVTNLNGEKLWCWIYIYNKSLDNVAQIKSGDFFNP